MGNGYIYALEPEKVINDIYSSLWCPYMHYRVSDFFHIDTEYSMMSKGKKSTHFIELKTKKIDNY